MTVATRPHGAPARAGRVLALLAPSLLLAAGCGGPATVPPPVPEPPSPFADCTALTSAPQGASPGAAAPAGASPGIAAPDGASAGAASPSAAVDLPDVTLPCFTGGQPVRLTDLRGPAVINLWGSWCEPCREELPAVQRLADRAAGRLHVIGVDTFDTRDGGGSFAADKGVRVPTLYDRDRQLMSALGVLNLPVTVFVDGAGASFVHRGRKLDDAALTALTGRHTGVAVRP